ncbi:uncharacterized protein PV07_00787 [Cladophialophora immunda]|uniref:Uncharacterized protein n=1 Tax=Cladophialophora immunda TaxID=569365 RepID=A0A0D2DE83_9EURO|nr:uncharacterized protein PV07_00787 [Cladophialophora immunda]KIW33979.1 hypothetical protein PV07_00787 [Cladophialophora immunda]OQU94556.1 hypothetical protein CLAIMM_00902 isoform 2 [Cladophialophora immunda]
MTTKLSVSHFTRLLARTAVLQVLISTATPFDIANISNTSSNNCVWEFSPAICGEAVSYQELVYPTTTECMPLAIGMKNVWTNECSDWFGKIHCGITILYLTQWNRAGACTMWIQPDCTGEWSLRIDDPANTHLGTCFSEYYYIMAVSCEPA